MSHHPQILVPRRTWRVRDMMALFPTRRTPNFSIASKMEELMAKRFGGLAICGTCGWKHERVLHRWGYYRHPDIRFQGNACDFCEQVYEHLALWPKEEHPYPTQQHLHDEFRRYGIRSTDHAAYDSRRRALAHVS